jgi:hypothetical protein
MSSHSRCHEQLFTSEGNTAASAKFCSEGGACVQAAQGATYATPCCEFGRAHQYACCHAQLSTPDSIRRSSMQHACSSRSAPSSRLAPRPRTRSSACSRGRRRAAKAPSRQRSRTTRTSRRAPPADMLNLSVRKRLPQAVVAQCSHVQTITHRHQHRERAALALFASSQKHAARCFNQGVNSV